MDTDLEFALNELLNTTDPASTSINSIIYALEKSLQRDLSAIKDDITSHVLEFMESKLNSIGPQRQEKEETGIEKEDAVTSQKKNPKKNVFNREYRVSEPLEDLIGQPFCSRPELVKKIWAYVRQNNLQDPKDKRFIICDEKLIKVFKKKRVSCFGMNKEFTKHLFKPEDIAPVKKIDEIKAASKLQAKLIALPDDLLSLGCFKKNMTYPCIQKSFLAYLEQFRSSEDPDIIILPDESHCLSFLFDENRGSMDIFALMK